MEKLLQKNETLFTIGFMLVMIFYKSKSIIPCVLFHITFNALSIFATGNSSVISSIVLIIICLVYTLYICKETADAN